MRLDSVVLACLVGPHLLLPPEDGPEDGPDVEDILDNLLTL